MLDNKKDDQNNVGGFAREMGRGLLDDAKRSLKNGLLLGGVLAGVFGVVGFFLFGLQGLLIGAGAGFAVGFVLGFVGLALFY